MCRYHSYLHHHGLPPTLECRTMLPFAGLEREMRSRRKRPGCTYRHHNQPNNAWERSHVNRDAANTFYTNFLMIPILCCTSISLFFILPLLFPLAITYRDVCFVCLTPAPLATRAFLDMYHTTLKREKKLRLYFYSKKKVVLYTTL
ncbi:hypothetical protein LY78DRAFT_99643 [Colletotrichum sublineola]|nr:hypothetical protein LY78DRAFT_99643 [Colletotrichum sublineola]